MSKAAVEPIVTIAAFGIVVSEPADDVVVTIAAEKLVIAFAALEIIIPRIAPELIVAQSAEDRVRKIGSLQNHFGFPLAVCRRAGKLRIGRKVILSL